MVWHTYSYIYTLFPCFPTCFTKKICCFVSLVWFFMSQATDMVKLRRSVHLTTLFPLHKAVSHTFACNWQQPFLNQRKRRTWRMFMTNLHKSMGPGQVRNVTPGSAVGTHYRLRYGTRTWCKKFCCVSQQKVSEYDQEISYSHAADNSMPLWGKDWSRPTNSQKTAGRQLNIGPVKQKKSA